MAHAWRISPQHLLGRSECGEREHQGNTCLLGDMMGSIKSTRQQHTRSKSWPKQSQIPPMWCYAEALRELALRTSMVPEFVRTAEAIVRKRVAVTVAGCLK
jgi:hypothetical protein